MSHFTFLMVNRLCLVHVPAFPTCTASPRLSFVCFFGGSFSLFEISISLITVLKLCLHSWYGAPGCAPIMQCLTSMIPWVCFSFALTPIIHLCLICCSFPLASAPPFLPTIGLNRSGSQSATPVGGKIKTLLLLKCSFYLFYYPASFVLNSSSFIRTLKVHSLSGSGMLGCVVSGD